MTKWIECPYCSHKLFKVTSDVAHIKLEVKCPSCKKIYPLFIEGRRVKSEKEGGGKPCC